MAWLLMMLVGCGGVGNDSTVYDACIAGYATSCDCGDTSLDGHPDGYCAEEEADVVCGRLVDEVGDGSALLDYQNCFNAAYAQDCKKKTAEVTCQEEYSAYLAEG
jgi:hypothetical protein